MPFYNSFVVSSGKSIASSLLTRTSPVVSRLLTCPASTSRLLTCRSTVILHLLTCRSTVLPHLLTCRSPIVSRFASLRPLPGLSCGLCRFHPGFTCFSCGRDNCNSLVQFLRHPAPGILYDGAHGRHSGHCVFDTLSPYFPCLFRRSIQLCGRLVQANPGSFSDPVDLIHPCIQLPGLCLEFLREALHRILHTRTGQHLLGVGPEIFDNCIQIFPGIVLCQDEQVFHGASHIFCFFFDLALKPFQVLHSLARYALAPVLDIHCFTVFDLKFIQQGIHPFPYLRGHIALHRPGHGSRGIHLLR